MIVGKKYYHVSSIQTEAHPILRKYNKPLQNVIDFFLELDVSSFFSFQESCVVAKMQYPDILKHTGRDMSKWMTETIFETIRKKQFSELPSRMNGFFLFSSLKEAREFQHIHRENGKIYYCFVEETLVPVTNVVKIAST